MALIAPHRFEMLIVMNDKDHVFARFKDDKPASADRRETLTIPCRAGAPGSRSVEVVHIRTGSVVRDRPPRQDPYVRAASWDGGFPTKHTTRVSMPVGPAGPEAAQPVTHVMPAWEPAAAEADAAPAEEPVVAPRRGRGRPRKQLDLEPPVARAGAARAEEPVVGPSHDRGRRREQRLNSSTRRVADPFDVSDAGTNCMRCGYAIEARREKQGLLTCSECV